MVSGAWPLRTALDTNVLSAIWHGEQTAKLLSRHLNDAQLAGSVVISGVVYAELLANPRTTQNFVDTFLRKTRVTIDFNVTDAVWVEAGLRFRRYTERRRSSGGGETKRLLADYIIGAHALLQADRLMTLDPGRYQQDFPELRLF